MGTWRTWVLTSGSELRPPPPAHDSAEMRAELQAVQAFTRTPKSNADAMFWEFGAMRLLSTSPSVSHLVSGEKMIICAVVLIATGALALLLVAALEACMRRPR